MKKSLSVALLVILLFANGATVVADSQSSAAKLDLFYTPEGSLAVSREDHENLDASGQDSVTRLLTYLNVNDNSHVIEDGKLKIIGIDAMPQALRLTANVWNNRHVNTLKKEKPVERTKKGEIGLLSTAPYPGAYYWYTHTLKGTSTTYSPTFYKLLHEGRTASCANSLQTIKWEVGKFFTLSTSASVQGQLGEGQLSATLGFSVGASLTVTCSTSVEMTIPKGHRGEIKHSYGRTYYTAEYFEFYWEDWNEDGVGDYCYYTGIVVGTADRIDKGYADTFGPFPSPCTVSCPVCRGKL